MSSKWKILVWAFWIFIAVMLAKQAFEFNSNVSAEKAANPEKHYFYNPGGMQPEPPPGPPMPDVRQTFYQVLPDTPVAGNFTVKFAVKNMGVVTATSVQVKVRPYRGIVTGDEDNGHAHSPNQLPGQRPSGGGDLPGTVGPLSDQDPTSQFGQWVSVPDLAPGQLYSGSVVFADEPNETPNENPKLEIDFQPPPAK